MSAATILALISPVFNCVEMALVAGLGQHPDRHGEVRPAVPGIVGAADHVHAGFAIRRSTHVELPTLLHVPVQRVRGRQVVQDLEKHGERVNKALLDSVYCQ